MTASGAGSGRERGRRAVLNRDGHLPWAFVTAGWHSNIRWPIQRQRGKSGSARGNLCSYPLRLIHTEAWAGSTARLTTSSNSLRTVSRSTASRRRAVKAATVTSAS